MPWHNVGSFQERPQKGERKEKGVIGAELLSFFGTPTASRALSLSMRVYTIVLINIIHRTSDTCTPVAPHADPTMTKKPVQTRGRPEGREKDPLLLYDYSDSSDCQGRIDWLLQSSV